ncbi:MAG: YkgJ family cysteine cluster protein [Pseudomonas sp.]|uniref:YkgJ family cysteine cluster protein n=1 Tax=Pseudomonas sp. TaxID=306 RepID=UPI00339725A0
MTCRSGCGACCVAPSISSPLPGMPDGKPAGVACLHLLADYRCALFGQAGRPAVCAEFGAAAEVCGDDREQAIRLIGWLEQATTPGPLH